MGAGLYCDPAAGDQDRLADKPTAREGRPKDIMAKLSTLKGDWILLEENGEETGVIGSRFRVSPSGSGLMVLEEMFPGSPDGHDTINVYQAEGERVYLIHYCPVANQPRAEIQLTDDENRLSLKFDRVTDQLSPGEDKSNHADYIFHGDVRRADYIFHGEDRVTTRWSSAPDDNLSGENSIAFELKRKR